MTRLEMLQIIGDVITKIDVLRGSLLPDDPNRHKLDDLRDLLDGRQRKLAQATFDDNTDQFQRAAANLQAVDAQIQGSLQGVDNLVATLNNIKTFLDSVTTVMSAIGPFI